MTVTKRYGIKEQPVLGWMCELDRRTVYDLERNMPDENVYSIKFQSDGVVEVEMDGDSGEEVGSKEVEG